MLQPAQRKLKPVDQLSSLLSQQTAKLVSRGRQVQDILDDIRLLGKQKSELEQQYAQSLLKLTKQLLSKKDLFQGALADANSNKRTVSSAWRSILEETQTSAWQRIKAAEQYNDRVCEPSRLLKERVAAAVKRGLDHLKTVQDELMQSTKEMTERYKSHGEDEAASVDALNKLNEENTRIQNSPRAPTANLPKVRERREACIVKAARTRNSYLIEWAAANAHSRYYNAAQLPDSFKALNVGVFSQISDILRALVKSDQDVCTAITTMQKKVQECASAVNHDFDLQCFLDANPELTDPLQFDCGATCDGQAVASIMAVQSESHHLNQEARKWAAKIAKERALEKTAQKRLAELEVEDPSPYVPMQPLDVSSSSKKRPVSGVENAVGLSEQDKLRMGIQKSQIGIAKATARLDLIKEAGIDVDSILLEACSAPIDKLDKLDSLSVNSSNSGGGPSGGSLPPGMPHSPARSEPPTFKPYRVTALFPHEPRVPDELCLTVGDVFTVHRPAADDGWVWARDALGRDGLLPLNYVKHLPDDVESESTYEVLPAVDHSNKAEDEYLLPVAQPQETAPPARERMTLLSNAIVQSPNDDAAPPSDTATMPMGVVTPPNESVTLSNENDCPPVVRRPPKPAPRPPSVVLPLRPRRPSSITRSDENSNRVVWLRALCGYMASNEEELSFKNGDRIMLVSKDDATGDGFWKGQLPDGNVGFFPSILVEEAEDDGVQVTPLDQQSSASG